MFYSHEILKKRGKFGIIWLAATSRKRISRRDIWSVNVVRSSDDVINILTQYETLEKRKARLSLYLSSQLMYGLSFVQSQKCIFLYEETKAMLRSLGSFKIPVETCIDLAPPIDSFKVTFPSPNMSDVSPDFGRLHPLPEPSDHRFYEFFLVTTPKSSEEEWVITPGPPDDLRALEPMPEGAELLHTSLHSDITMEDPVEFEREEIIPFEIPLEENVDFLTGPLAFIDPVDLDELHTSQVLPEPALAPTQLTASPQRTTPPHAATPPQDVAFVMSPHGSIAMDDEPPVAPRPDEPPAVDGTPPQPDRQRRRALPDDDRDGFVLDPVVQPGRRRRRRRHLVVDPVTVLPPDKMRNNIHAPDDTVNRCLQIRKELLNRRVPANTLLQRLNARVVPPHFRDIFSRLHTLPEPNFRMSDDEEPDAVVDEPPVDMPAAEQQEPAAPVVEQEEAVPLEEEVFENEPVELRRAGESLEGTLDAATGGMLTISSLKVPDASSGTLHGTRDLTNSPMPSMLHVDDYMEHLQDMDILQPGFGPLDDMMEAQPGKEIPQPNAEAFEEDVEERTDRSLGTAPACQYSPVSPERIPPLSSHESMTSALEDAMDHIRELASDGRLDFISLIKKLFNEVINTIKGYKMKKLSKKESKTILGYKTNVGLLFSLLLHLHAQGKIHLHQRRAWVDIEIQILDPE